MRLSKLFTKASFALMLISMSLMAFSIFGVNTVAAQDVSNESIAGAAGEGVAAADGVDLGVSGQADGSIDDSFNEAECDFGTVLNWLLCPFMRGVDKIIFDWIINDERIEGLFSANFESGEGLFGDDNIIQNMKTMWTNMRNITNALFIILFVVAIFGHVTGAIEAYTAKKIIPRIVIAAILTQLSWFISVELSAIFDDFGKGIGALLETTLEVEDVELVDVVFPDKATISNGAEAGVNNASTTASILFGIGTSIVILSTTTVLWLLLPFAVGILVSIMITVVTLLARKVILIMMVIVSPIAMTMWALPTTDKWSRRWFSWYTRLLAMFPFIVALIAVGKAVAKVLSGAGQEGGNERSWIFTIAALLTYMAPYALLPLTLKLAISTISNLTGVLDNAGKSLTGRAKSFSQQQRTDIKAQKQKDNLELYAGSNKWKNREKGTAHGRRQAAKDLYGRAKGRAFSGAALPTRYNNRVIDDLAAQAQAEDTQRTDADGKQRMADYATVMTDGGPRSESYRRTAVIEDIEAQVTKLGGEKGLEAEEQALLAAKRRGAGRQELHNLAGSVLSKIESLQDSTREEDQAKRQEFAERLYGEIGDADGLKIAENSRILRSQLGEEVTLANGEKKKVTAAMKVVATTENVNTFDNDAKAIDAVHRFVRHGRYEGSVADQRAVKTAVDANVGTMMKGSKQFLLGYGGAVDSGFDAVVRYSEGGIKDIAANSDDATFKRLLKNFADGAANPSANAAHKAINGKTIMAELDQRIARGDGVFNSEMKDSMSKIIDKDGAFVSINQAGLYSQPTIRGDDGRSVANPDYIDFNSSLLG